MQNISKYILAAAAAFTVATPGVHAQDSDLGEPIVTFKTNIYSEAGANNAFHIVLGSTETTDFDIDYGFGAEMVEVSPAIFDSESSSIVGTTVQMRAKEDGIVKIYGDPSKLDYLHAEGCYIDWIDLSRCTNMEILDLQHNELKSLDLTPLSKLYALYLTDNPFTEETPLIVGPNKPDLTILEIDIIDWIDPNFNLNDYPSLVTVDAYHNMSLRKAEVSNCPELRVLSLEMTPVETLDVTANPKLTRLNISESRIRNIDLSQNEFLQHFLSQHVSGTINTDVRLESIDLTHNPNLVLVNIGGNNLPEVDLSKNTLLTNLGLRRNNISSIDLSACTNLYSVDLAYNDLDFATLPLPESTWGEYYYYRDPLACRRSYAAGESINFADRVCRTGTETTVRVWRDPIDGAPEELAATEYSYSNGAITFPAAIADSVYVEFINSAFEEYTLRSGSFMVKNPAEIGQASETVRLAFSTLAAGKEVSLRLGVNGATTSHPASVILKIGDGEESSYSVTASASTPDDLSTISFTLPASGATSVTLSLPENEVLGGLVLDGAPLSNIYLSAATELRHLAVTNCSLRTINLANNRCLQTLNLAGNSLGNVDLTAVYGDYEKNLLTDINLSGNQIYNFVVVATRQLRNLNLANNRLTGIDLKNYDSLTNLDLSHNRLKADLSLVYLANAEKINLSYNDIDSVTIADMPYLKHFDISNNKFSIRTLPVMEASQGYIYAPQQPLEIIRKAPGVNISAQYRDIDGQTTQFQWCHTDGTPITSPSDLTCDNGATRFINPDLGTVYCRLSHPAFPDLSGENAYTTTAVEVTGAPSTVVASFVTPESSAAGSVIVTGYTNSALYIDWRGDGTEYIQYPMVADTYSSYNNQQTYAGANVKVYTYDSPEDVKQFSIYGVTMSQLDASPLSALKAFAIGGAELDEETLTFPATTAIEELNLEGNNFSTKDFSEFAQLRSLVLNNNSYTTFNAGKLPALETLSMSNNRLSEISFANPALWGVALAGNEFAAISFDGAPELSQILAGNNHIESVDLSAVKSVLRVLDLSNNALDFTTLPLNSDYPLLQVYYYSTQAPIDAACVEGKVDLSSQAMVNGTATEYRWYLGDVDIDPSTGAVTGEELYGPTTGDEAEYWVTDGVTRFAYTFDKPLTGLLTNSQFKDLMLFTVPVYVNAAGIDNVTVSADGATIAPDELVDVCDLQGIVVRRNIRFADAFTALPSGIYIVKGHKFLHN